MIKTLTLAACSLGIILSPETLRILGNTSGGSGFVILASIFLMSIAYYFIASSLRPYNPANLMYKAYGHTAALVTTFTGRIMFTITASAALVVTAGFIFNEVFFYRFPNFAFAYLLLFAIIGINFFGQITMIRIQGALVLIILLCLGILIAQGLISFESIPVDKKGFTPSPTLELLALPMLLFIGVETAWIIDNTDKRAITIALGIAAIVLALWSIVSLMHVAPGKLSRTSIPFTIAARNIMGDTGRYLIAVAAIAGCAAAVNTMLMGLNSLAMNFAKENILPEIVTKKKGAIPLLIGGLGAAGIMLAGFAGHDELKTVMRAGLILWALSYVFMAMAAWRLQKKPTTVASSIFALIAILSIIISSHESTLLIKIMSYAVTISIVICFTINKITVKEK